MDFGILRALKTLKSHPYVQYVGLGFAGLVQTGQQDDQAADGGAGQHHRGKKSKMQLIRLSAAVCGIELCYAAETAFVSPILLKLGVPVSLMTMIWCLSPVLGFFLVPVMGSLSDRCPLGLGRRRPFILVMSVGIVLGLALVPNGEAIGLWMGDTGTATLHHPKYFAPLPTTPTVFSNLSTTTAAANQYVANKRRHLSTRGKEAIGPDARRPDLKEPVEDDPAATASSTSRASNPRHGTGQAWARLMRNGATANSNNDITTTASNNNNNHGRRQSGGADMQTPVSSWLTVLAAAEPGTQERTYSEPGKGFSAKGQGKKSSEKRENYSEKGDERRYSKKREEEENLSVKGREISSSSKKRNRTKTPPASSPSPPSSASPPSTTSSSYSPFLLTDEHFRGIILTILGVALLDFNCDACQSPCRAYLLDVTTPEDHSAGLTMFTVMAGLGGTVGYVMGGIDWNSTRFGEAFGGHVRVVFTLVVAVFIVCVASTLTSFRETPLKELDGYKTEEGRQKKKKKVGKSKYRKFTNEGSSDDDADDEESRQETKAIDGSASLHAMYGAFNQLNETGNRGKNSWDPFEPALFKNGGSDGGGGGGGLASDTNTNTNSSDDTVNFYHHAHESSSSYVRDLQATGAPDANGGTMIPNGVQRQNHGDKNTGESDDRDGDAGSFGGRGGERKYVMNGPMTNLASLTASAATTTKAPPEVAGSLIPPPPSAHPPIEISTDVTLRTYLRSILHMPRCLWVLCTVNLFCWMSLVCYSLYFTDFVGQAVFLGDPQAPPGSQAHNAYDDGVRLGSFGMSLYSLSCSVYSLLIERLVRRFRAKRVYVCGQLVFTVGMAVLATSRHKMAVLLLSPTAGVMYATLFTMPYLLVAHYHTSGLFCHQDPEDASASQVRGLGTDVAIVSSMVFLAQFLLSVAMGTLVYALSSTTTVIVVSAVLSCLGAITATQVTYLDL